MKYRITQDQCFCSFGDGIVYEFIQHGCERGDNPCWRCAFRDHVGLKDDSVRCYKVPCQKGHRKDKKNGFWRISNAVDNQLFTKLV